MVAVIAILVALMTAGVSLLNGTGAQSRRAGTDMLAGLIDKARTTAITSRCHVVLAIAEPGDLPAGDERCRVGLFRVDKWPVTASAPLLLEAVLLNRWQMLNTGIALIGKERGGKYPLEIDQVTLSYGGRSVRVHCLAFNPRGSLQYPFGSTPITVGIAEGNYRNGEPSPYKQNGTVSESRLSIGRVTARPYRIDG